jgi:glycosyltransferase involved in cell wall biosynthesis
MSEIVAGPPMRILYVQHDMLVWSSARQWAYTTHMAYVEGLRAAGHDVLVLLTSCWPLAKKVVGDQRFDQVWVNDVTHILGARPAWEAPPPLGEEDFAWLASLAPVRVGIVMESLHYDPADYAEVPELGRRVPLMQRIVLPHVTHFAVVDENDVRHIENMGAQAVWTPCHVPRRFFRTGAPDTARPAVFIGSAYQRRAKYLQNERLRGLLEFRASAEHATELPAMFDHFNGEVRHALLGNDYRQADYEHFVDTMWKLRAKLFDVYLESLSGSLATINLPSFFKSYAGRVIESMAVGQPVVTWRTANRAQTARLFDEGEEILFFDGDDPDRLADSLERLRDERGLAARIGVRALANATRHHTSEHRVAQVLEWIRTGIVPRHWDEKEASS